MDIVFIADYHYFKNANSKISYNFINSIKLNNSKYNIHIFYTDCDLNYVQNEIIKINPTIIIIFEINSFQPMTTKFDFIFDLKIPTYIFIDDTYYISSLTQKCNYVKKTDGIIFWYKNELIKKSYIRQFPNKYINNIDSRYVNTDIYKDYKLNKKYDILIYGTREFYSDYKNQHLDSIQNYIINYEKKMNTIINDKINFYPLRHKLENILLKNKDKYNIKILFPVTIDGATIANEELSKLINESYLTISCCSIADVLLHKSLEIPASKSVILGNYPSDYKDLFEGNIIEVNEFMSDSEILSIIDSALSDKQALIEMGERLYKKVHEEHNLYKAQENFNNVLDNIIKYNIHNI